MDFCRTIVEPGAGCVLTASAAEAFTAFPLNFSCAASLLFVGAGLVCAMRLAGRRRSSPAG